MSGPGQNGPASEAGSTSNSPSLRGADSSNSLMHGGGGGAPPMALGGGGVGGGGEEKGESREQDRLLPIANISRLMKKVLPAHAKMSKESKSALQECVSEFIGFITSEASDRLMEEKRKTITGDDIIDSMRALGFDSYMEFLQSYLKKYRQSIKAAKGGGGAGGDKPAAGGAHKRGRKARGADDEDEEVDHSDSPTHFSDSMAHSVAAAASSSSSSSSHVPTAAAAAAGGAAHYTSHPHLVSPLTAQNLLAAQLMHANQSAGGGSTEDDKGGKRRKA